LGRCVCRKKVPSEPPVFELAGVELMRSNAAVYHISRYLPIVRRSTAAFTFVLCFTLPFKGKVQSLVVVLEARGLETSAGWASRRSGGAPPGHATSGARGGAADGSGDGDDDEDDDEDDERLVPVDLCLARCAGRPSSCAMVRLPHDRSPSDTTAPSRLCRFLADRGPLRNAKLKLIPSLVQGPWIVRHAVGQTPVMLGKRLKIEYFAEEGYIEADVDISANSTAAGVTSLVAGSIKSLVFDIGILLEVRACARVAVACAPS
jgi:Protein ENHANCED DISEASE RESISTANCE 2, C-terminal